MRIRISIKVKTKGIKFKIFVYLNLEILKAIVTKWNNRNKSDKQNQPRDFKNI